MAEGNGGGRGGGGGGGSDVALAFLRLAGLGLAYHGYQKVFGGDMSSFARSVEKIGFPVPIVFAWLAALSEFLGGGLVAVGLFTRLGATFAAITMFVAAFLKHATDDFDTREKALSYLVIMLALALLGPGKWSVDGLVRKSV
jgi:putative oxidoreductase